MPDKRFQIKAITSTVPAINVLSRMWLPLEFVTALFIPQPPRSVETSSTSIAFSYIMRIRMGDGGGGELPYLPFNDKCGFSVPIKRTLHLTIRNVSALFHVNRSVWI